MVDCDIEDGIAQKRAILICEMGFLRGSIRTEQVQTGILSPNPLPISAIDANASNDFSFKQQLIISILLDQNLRCNGVGVLNIKNATGQVDHTRSGCCPNPNLSIEILFDGIDVIRRQTSLIDCVSEQTPVVV